MDKPEQVEEQRKTKRQKMAPWLLLVMVIGAGAVATWTVFGNAALGRLDAWIRAGLWLLAVLLSLYIETLLFGVIGWYVALLAAIAGVVAVLAGHFTHNAYTFYSGWMLLIIATALGGVALLLRSYIKYR